MLDSDDITKAFDDKNVKRLRADWTKPNDEISQFLAEHDRFGIPFNIVYGPNTPQGIILPELLTIGAVQDAISQAID